MDKRDKQILIIDERMGASTMGALALIIALDTIHGDPAPGQDDARLRREREAAEQARESWDIPEAETRQVRRARERKERK